MEHWLLLTDYASKYRISVSTLRRRIKAGQQKHRFEGGRYYLPDNGAPAPETAAELKQSTAPSAPARNVAEPLPQTEWVSTEETLITTTSKLLNELKHAYTQILHEKEDQILHLKEEISDLKTLVRCLESENLRLGGPRDYDRSEEGRDGGAYGSA